MIYIASPFTHKDPAVRARRASDAAAYEAALLARGVKAFSPIAATAKMPNLPIEFEFWAPLNDALVRASEAVHVLQIEGWDTSRGVAHEIALAASLGIPVEWVRE